MSEQGGSLEITMTVPLNLKNACRTLNARSRSIHGLRLKVLIIFQIQVLYFSDLYIYIFLGALFSGLV